jgi:hypothetical protein
MSTAVSASRSRVWRALTDPEAMILWDDQILSLVEPADGYPETCRQIRWRYRMGSVPVTLRHSAVDVVPGERLHTESALGLFRFDETYTLGSQSDSTSCTLLNLSLRAENSLPVVGGILDRFAVRRVASEMVDRKLRSIQIWCESAD